ncbi:hypothetical protein HYU07_00760 [Candidatus Woesearchaeota archaeon]|nr:hypothetical protein [Candidatus Woesearchaeota archaeon]
MMRASQWSVFGIAFMILGMILAGIGLQWNTYCGYNFEKEPISCIRQQVFAPFPYIFFLLGTVCFINGAIESWSKKKK